MNTYEEVRIISGKFVFYKEAILGLDLNFRHFIGVFGSGLVESAAD